MYDKLNKLGLEEKFIVIKISDLEKEDFKSQETIRAITTDIACRKAKPFNFCKQYIVINVDEPYAQDVVDIMHKYEKTHGCPYCNPYNLSNKNLIEGIEENSVRLTSNNELVIGHGSPVNSTKIRFCPKCGRDLEVGNY